MRRGHLGSDVGVHGGHGSGLVAASGQQRVREQVRTRLRGGGEGKAGSVWPPHVLNMSEVAAAEFQVGKLTTRVKMCWVSDMVHACTDLEYINPTCSSNIVPPPT